MDLEFLEKVVEYDQELEILVWKKRPLEMFTSQRLCNRWNTRYSGKELGSLCPTSGYIRVRLDGKSYLYHRLLWLLVYKEEPDTVDHIDGDRTNNKLSNLRNVEFAENAKNKRRMSNNTSGCTGVHFCKKKKKIHFLHRCERFIKKVGSF